jgi:parvulin-like peptidyl-prolyl isomerase
MKKFNLTITICVCFGLTFLLQSSTWSQTRSNNVAQNYHSTQNRAATNPNPTHNTTHQPQPTHTNQHNNTNKNNTENNNNNTAPQHQRKIELPETMAVVNDEIISKKDVTNESLRMFGDVVLKDLIKRTLVELECRRRNVVVSQEDINAEILRMAKAFNFTTEDWLALIERERGITAEQYMQDIIFPIIGIARLAGNNTVTDADLQRAYESSYGVSVQVRQIVLRSKRDAQQILAQVQANPDSFAKFAQEFSVDPASQPYGGLIHPIRRHTTDKVIENVVFSLREGQISNVVEWTGMFIIFRCEKHLPAQNVDIEQVRARLETKIRDEKTRESSAKFFSQLIANAKIETIFGDPLKQSQKPGYAAIVNGYPITIDTLAELCLKRHGKDVLNDMINRLIIVQECRKKNIVINDRDIDTEIREMAIKNLPLKPEDGQPDVERWMKLAMEESGMTAQLYRINTVFPILALKRLSKSDYAITEVDLQKSYESNFGEKVRCLAITLDPNDYRRAMEVWQKANTNRNEKYFRELSEKYSSDPALRLSGGVIPLIHRHSSDPNLEKEAFALNPGEISQVISGDEKCTILYCIGREPASNIKLEDVKADLIADLHDKMQTRAVANYYEKLYRSSMIVNNLTGTQTQNEVAQKDAKTQQPTTPNTTPGIGTANQKNSIPIVPIM